MHQIITHQSKTNHISVNRTLYNWISRRSWNRIQYVLDCLSWITPFKCIFTEKILSVNTLYCTTVSKHESAVLLIVEHCMLDFMYLDRGTRWCSPCDCCWRDYAPGSRLPSWSDCRTGTHHCGSTSTCTDAPHKY